MAAYNRPTSASYVLHEQVTVDTTGKNFPIVGSGQDCLGLANLAGQRQIFFLLGPLLVCSLIFVKVCEGMGD
jgi:hypothetical protein